MNCLLIDDDLDDQDFFTMALDELSIKVSLKTANNGMEALEFLRETQYQPQVIFMDINMPRMDGWECLAEIRKIDRLRTVPVVIYTTSENYFRPGELKEKGVMEYVTKQPRVSSLVILLEALFEKINAKKTYAG